MTVTTLHVRRAATLADHVAANIRAEAARAGVTQRALASSIGLSQASASARWRGVTPWTLNDIEAVAHVLGTTTSVLCAIRDLNPEPAD
ncbi:MAG: helix-turn-helix domain-containing protein [Actinobacteria bacterium]|nr:helix-turn-helix domain-containing protein [Actinomycetota bacterium]